MPTMTGATGERPPLARGPVAAAMLALAVVLAATSTAYGYHRDELYFRLLPTAWGYVDQPPLAPLLARATTVLADEVWALRLPALVTAVVSVYLVASITREVGGGRTAQAFAAWGYAFAAFTLSGGHMLLTSSLDLPVWPAIVLFVIRAFLRADPRWWLAVGAVAGVSTYSKLLVAILLVAMLVGFLVTGPRAPLRSPWLWAGVALALLIAAPNIAYQLAHGVPQLEFGRVLSAENSGEVRVLMWPMLLVLLGPPLTVVVALGLRAMWVRPTLRPIRGLVVALPVLLVLVFLMGAQFYYPYGFLAALYAIGCASLTHRAWWVAIGLNAAVCAVISLPLVPVGALGATPIPSVNQAARDSVGWPTYVAQITRAYATLPASDRARSVILTSNYGEAGALDRFAPERLRERVVSGHNALADGRRPTARQDVVLVVGDQYQAVAAHFDSCRVIARLDNGVDVDNEEQEAPIAVCRGQRQPWTQLWPRLRHLG